MFTFSMSLFSSVTRFGRFRAIWALFQSSWQFFSWSKSPRKMAIFWAIFQNSPEPFILMLWSFSSQPKIAFFVKFSEKFEQILIVCVLNLSWQKFTQTIFFEVKWPKSTLKTPKQHQKGHFLLGHALGAKLGDFWIRLGSFLVKTSGHTAVFSKLVQSE